MITKMMEQSKQDEEEEEETEIQVLIEEDNRIQRHFQVFFSTTKLQKEIESSSSSSSSLVSLSSSLLFPQQINYKQLFSQAIIELSQHFSINDEQQHQQTSENMIVISLSALILLLALGGWIITEKADILPLPSLQTLHSISDQQQSQNNNEEVTQKQSMVLNVHCQLCLRDLLLTSSSTKISNPHISAETTSTLPVLSYKDMNIMHTTATVDEKFDEEHANPIESEQQQLLQQEDVTTDIITEEKRETGELGAIDQIENSNNDNNNNSSNNKFTSLAVSNEQVPNTESEDADMVSKSENTATTAVMDVDTSDHAALLLLLLSDNIMETTAGTALVVGDSRDIPITDDTKEALQETISTSPLLVVDVHGAGNDIQERVEETKEVQMELSDLQETTDIISTIDSSAGLINQPIQLHHSELEQAVPNNPVVMTKSTLTLEGDDGTDSSNVNATTTVLSQPTNTVETINKPSIKRYHLQKEHRHFCPHSLTHPHTSSLSELFKQHLMNHPSTIASSFVYPQQHMTAMNSSSKKRKRQSETTLITESSNCASAPMEISRRLSTELGDDGGNDDDNDNKEETAEYIFRRIREIFDMNGG
jgi:hypothetical protein